MVTDWQEGHYGEAIGRGTFEAICTIDGPKELDKLGKVDDSATDQKGASPRAVKQNFINCL